MRPHQYGESSQNLVSSSFIEQDSFEHRKNPISPCKRICSMLCKAIFMITIVLVLTWPIPRNTAVISSATKQPLAHTLNGTYAGIYSATYEQDKFLGIPYAQPPLGRLRFCHPQSLTDSWSDVRNATAYGPHCPAYGDHQEVFRHSEDCLSINIIRPRTTKRALLPVAVYIHGGATHGGGSSDGRNDLTFLVSMAAKAGFPFIGVSFNYRSSVWGFINSRQIRGEGNTNIGLHDQRKALHWIQENIAAFGGDPKKVTIWGGSSGADDVGLHLIAYGGRDDGLFRAAILNSGSPVVKTSVNGYPVQDMFERLLGKTGCIEAKDGLECLRGLPFEKLNDAFMDSPDGTGPMTVALGLPAIDGGMVPGFGSLSLKQGRFVKVPVMSGIVSNEGSNWIPPHIRDFADLQSYLKEELSFPQVVIDRLTNLYPEIKPGDNDKLEPPLGSISNRAEFQRIERLLGDLMVNAASRLLCENFAVVASCCSYRFDALVPNEADERTGVRHGTEMGPLFQNTKGLGFQVNPFEGKGDDFHSMAHLMGIMWAGFITEMDPNVGLSASSSKWPRYTVKARERIVITEKGSWVEEDGAREAGLEYINSIQHSVLER